MTWLRQRLGEEAEQRVGVLQHADLAQPGDALVGFDLDDGEIAPRGAQDMGILTPLIFTGWEQYAC